MENRENDLQPRDGAENMEEAIEEEIVEEFEDPSADNLVVLTDESGSDVTFEFLDLVLLNGQEYVVLLPLEDAAGDVVIFRVEGAGDEESYVGLSDDAEAQAVYEEFKRRNRDNFAFEE